MPASASRAFSSFLLVAALVVLFAAMATLAAAALPARQAPPQVTGYYVCVLAVGSSTASTVYLSDVIPDTGFRPGPVATGFREFTTETYQVKGQPECFERRTEAEARDFIKTTSPGQKKVMTGWKFSAAPTAAPAAATKPVTPQPDTSKPRYGTTGPSGELQGYCYEFANQKMYITQPFLYGTRTSQTSQDRVDAEFADFIMKKYGTQPGASAACAGLRDANRVTTSRQLQLDQAQGVLKVQVVELDWTPAQKTAPAAQNPGAAGQVAQTYSFCYATGSPKGENNPTRYHFYITQTLPRAAAEPLDDQFRKFINAAHPNETLSASCTPAWAMAQAEKNRQDTVAGRKRPNYDIVEITWKR